MRRSRTGVNLSEADQRIGQHLRQARRAVDEALRIAQKDGSRRNRRVMRDLYQVVNALDNVSSLTPLWDTSDPDHMSEDELAALMRKRREEERIKEQLTPPLTSEVIDD